MSDYLAGTLIVTVAFVIVLAAFLVWRGALGGKAPTESSKRVEEGFMLVLLVLGVLLVCALFGIPPLDMRFFR